jgi:uncharacterized protein YkwD
MIYLPNMQLLVDLHNEARTDASWLRPLSPFKMDDKLMKYAYDWAKYMSETNKMTHSKMSNILKLGFNTVGENIAWGQETEKDVINTWLWSPGHRSNIMSATYTHIGCSAMYSKYHRLFWCVCFGKAKI